MYTGKLEIGLYAGSAIAFTGETADTKDLGGAEYCAVKLAEALAARGHEVTVMTEHSDELYGKDGLQEIIHKNVCYLSAKFQWQRKMRYKNWDVFVVSREYNMLTSSLVKTKQLILWNHDTLSNPEAFLEHIYPADRIYCLSEWHKQHYIDKVTSHAHNREVLKQSHITVTRNGVDVQGIQSALDIVKDFKFPNPTFLYCSRPERGLLYLLRDIWPKIINKIPEAELLICSYNINQELLPDVIKQIHDECNYLSQTVQNVKPLGHLPRHDLYKIMAASWALLYPSVFPEISCLSVMESQACGTPAITSNYAALRETNLNRRLQIFDKEKILTNDQEHLEFCTNFIQRFVENYRIHARVDQRLLDQTIMLKRNDWHTIAKEWEEDIYKHFERRNDNHPKRIIQNLIYHSDLLAAQWAANHARVNAENIDDENEMFTLEQEINTYLTHHHDEPEQYGNAIDVGPAEDITQTPERMMIALDMIGKRFGTDTPFTLLDCGCGTGRMLYAVLKSFPKARVMGLDFSHECLRRADENLRKLIPGLNLNQEFCTTCGGSYDLHMQKRGVGSQHCENYIVPILPFLQQGDFLEVDPPMGCRDCGVAEAVHDKDGFADDENCPTGEFQTSLPDVIWLGEWLEHQIELEQALHHVNNWCKPGGLVIYSIPNGPWEALSYGETFTKEGHEIRFHVSHFEERDIHEMFKDVENLQYAYAYIQRSAIDNSPIGQFTVSYTARPATQFYTPDYKRKFYTTRPRWTIGATLITKNEEHNILRAIKPLEKRVEHILIGDTGSTDRTIELAQKHAEVVSIEWDMNTGFAGARNLVRDILCSKYDIDYLLWIDADELILDSHKLRQYTQGDLSIYEAVIICQHHLMIDMPVTFDGPQRLFKNNPHYRFHGIIHEQPCDLGKDPDGNEVIFPSLIVRDVKIAHYGYTTEQERRQKAIERNLPLLKKDRELNPNRELGKLFEMRDYSNNIKWFIEKNPQGPLQTIHVAMLHGMIAIYQDFKDPRHQNHALAKVFYQDALRFMGQYQIPYQGMPSNGQQVPFQVAHLLIGVSGELNQDSLKYTPHTEWFLTTEDIQDYLKIQSEKLVSRLQKPIDIFEV